MGLAKLRFTSLPSKTMKKAWHGLMQEEQASTPRTCLVIQSCLRSHSLGYKELFVWFSENGANLKVTNHEDEDVVIHLLNQDNEEMAEWVRRRDV